MRSPYLFFYTAIRGVINGMKKEKDYGIYGKRLHY